VTTDACGTKTYEGRRHLEPGVIDVIHIVDHRGDSCGQPAAAELVVTETTAAGTRVTYGRSL
jgi:hypothetical protein